MRLLGRILVACIVLCSPRLVYAQQFTYDNTPLLTVIKDIESQTAYRFLYREALVSPIKISMSASEEKVFDTLSEILAENSLSLKVDHERFQALIYRSSPSVQYKKVSISGYVLDANTGERLPTATISWFKDGKLHGVSASSSGTFSITQTIAPPTLTLLVSFVGYQPQRIQLSFEETTQWQDVAIRLEPATYSGKEIVVHGVNFYAAKDTVLSGLIKVGAFSPLGEDNAVRSLQTLPAVSLNTAVNDGINIRGSAEDGFQILLDGQTVYSQSHLFGLLDALNNDALKSSGFFYDITPAQYPAPLGGTLSLVTRTGSLHEFQGTAGISNTALKTTLEGPILKGRASWLLSGRMSYIDDLNWFNNQNLIEFGLDVNRPAEVQVPGPLASILIRDITLNEIEILRTEANFYDVHGKVHIETNQGAQLSISSYFGLDNARQVYTRDETDLISLNETYNHWKNQTLSATYNTFIGQHSILETRFSYGQYHSQYNKDDFAYPIRQTAFTTPLDTLVISPLSLNNSIKQFDFYQAFTTTFENARLEFGVSYSDFDVRYTELSLVRDSFISRRTSQLLDVFQQWDYTGLERLHLSLGNRVHYFSNGAYLRWSPRIKTSFTLSELTTWSIGFSRNYQFINRLQFTNINSNDFWILANQDQPPSSVNYYSTGLYLNVHPSLYLQFELYLKQYDHLRLHELNTGAVSVSFRNNKVPWLYENKGRSQGLEIMMKNRFTPLTLSTAYTLSSSKLQNERFNNGNYFYAPWDRRHQLSSVLELEPVRGLHLYFSWTYGSGAPEQIDITNMGQNQNTLTRMPDYSRFDLTMGYETVLGTSTVKTTFSVYNFTNRNNPWYVERKAVSVELQNRIVQGQALTNVFDLGIQPSFNIGIYF